VGGNPEAVRRTLTRMFGRFVDHTTRKVARFQDHRDAHLTRLRDARARWALECTRPAARALATQRTTHLETRWARWITAIDDRIRCALTRQALYSHALHALS
jgi:hypothetical protein